jgi:pimeloyl-ACP methyl ester carboxylesterase
VIVPDIRGAGASSRPKAGYETRQLAADIHALVRSLGFREVAVVGHDWGGAVAYSYATAYRDEVTRMANLEAGPPAGFGQEAAQDANPQLFWFVWLAREPAAEAIVRGREREFLTPLYRAFSFRRDAIRGAELDGYVCSFKQPGAMHAGFMLYRDEAKDATANREAAKVKLTIPVLAVGGEASLGDFGAALGQVATNVSSAVIPKAAHFLMTDNPTAVTRVLRTFLTQP